MEITTIANCFRHCKLKLERRTAFEQVGEKEGIHVLKEVISSLRYIQIIVIEQLLNNSSENDIVMELLLMKRLFKGNECTS